VHKSTPSRVFPRIDPVLTDPLFFVTALVAVLFLGLAKGGFTGVGLIATPMLSLLIPPLQAVAIVLPILILQDVMSVWVYRRDWDARNLKIMLPGAVIGVGVAWLFMAKVPEAAVRLAIGIVTLAFVLNQWFGKKPEKERGKPSIWRGAIAGGLSGFTSTISHAGGPPYQIYIMPQRLAKMTFVGTTAIFFAVVNAVKIAPVLALGQFTSKNLFTSAVLLPLAAATNYLGIVLVRRMPSELFYRIVYLVMFLLSLELIRGGAMVLIAK